MPVRGAAAARRSLQGAAGGVAGDALERAAHRLHRRGGVGIRRAGRTGRHALLVLDLDAHAVAAPVQPHAHQAAGAAVVDGGAEQRGQHLAEQARVDARLQAQVARRREQRQAAYAGQRLDGFGHRQQRGSDEDRFDRARSVHHVRAWWRLVSGGHRGGLSAGTWVMRATAGTLFFGCRPGQN